MAENPPAFPFSAAREIAPGCEVPTVFPGMTLRDWFAGQALAAYAQHFDFGVPGYSGGRSRDQARRMYDIADAMLSAREQGGGE